MPQAGHGWRERIMDHSISPAAFLGSREQIVVGFMCGLCPTLWRGSVWRRFVSQFCCHIPGKPRGGSLSCALSKAMLWSPSLYLGSFKLWRHFAAIF